MGSTHLEYVQYGCGWSSPEGWRNFDASPTLRFERIPVIGRLYTKNASRFPDNVEYGDIVRGLPIDEGTCAGIYCSHVLEHLSLADFRTALANTKKLLKPGGIFRMVLPDLEISVKRYVNSSDTDRAAADFMKETMLGLENRPKNPKEILYAWLGNSRHLWMWDFASIRSELEHAGFEAIRRAEYGDSSDPMFTCVEEKVRWEDCLGVECFKPSSS